MDGRDGRRPKRTSSARVTGHLNRAGAGGANEAGLKRRGDVTFWLDEAALAGACCASKNARRDAALL